MIKILINKESNFFQFYTWIYPHTNKQQIHAFVLIAKTLLAILTLPLSLLSYSDKNHEIVWARFVNITLGLLAFLVLVLTLLGFVALCANIMIFLLTEPLRIFGLILIILLSFLLFTVTKYIYKHFRIHIE